MKIEDLIRAIKQFVHEPKGQPVPRGVARSHQIMLAYYKEQARRQAAANKKVKVGKKRRSILREAQQRP